MTSEQDKGEAVAIRPAELVHRPTDHLRCFWFGRLSVQMPRGDRTKTQLTMHVGPIAACILRRWAR